MLGVVLAAAGAFGAVVRARRTVLVETSGEPLVGVNVVVRVTVSACCMRARLAAFERVQVSVTAPAAEMLRVVAQTLRLAARVVRRQLAAVPTCVTTPAPVAVNTVVIVEPFDVRVLTGSLPVALLCSAGAPGEVAAVVLALPPRSVAVGVTAFEAAESVLVPLPFVAVARKV